MDSYKLITDVQWQFLIEELENYFTDKLKFHLKYILVKLRSFFNCKNLQIKITKVCIKDLQNDLKSVEGCLDRIWEILNCGYWIDVSINYRYCYSACSVLKAILLEIWLNEERDKSKEFNNFILIIEQIDKGILLGAPLPNNPDLLTNMASKINEHFTKFYNMNNKFSNIIMVDKKSLQFSLLPGFSSIPHYKKPSMEIFFCNIFKPKVPAVLEGCTDHWKAMQLWKNVNYLHKIAGNRTVPIEIGSRYTEKDWSQSLSTISNFLSNFIMNTNEKTGYLAQHQLFNQIPELRKDFSIPEYCSFSDNEDNTMSPDINAWFGPKGTISPLHYDSKNNLLSQIFGFKRVILFCPEDTEFLYPYDNRMLKNTSKIDPYQPDYKNYPKFHQANGLMCYLKPGDMLFIPPKWWHHVVSLTPSFSINFWWE